MGFCDVMGGMYKIRVQIHRSELIYDYYRFQLHLFGFQKRIRTMITFIDLL